MEFNLYLNIMSYYIKQRKFKKKILTVKINLSITVSLNLENDSSIYLSRKKHVTKMSCIARKLIYSDFSSTRDLFVN